MALLLPVDPALASATRLRRLSSPALAGALDWSLLVGMGGLAAILSNTLDFGIRLPGQAILRAVLPMACGLALVPRRRAGLVMSCAAVVTAICMRGAVGNAGGLGAMTSLIATGPCLDLAMRRWRPRLGLWLSFAYAGMASNACAFVVRGLPKVTGWEVGRRPLFDWLSQASWSYLFCGMLAGLISGVVLFRGAPPRAGVDP